MTVGDPQLTFNLDTLTVERTAYAIFELYDSGLVWEPNRLTVYVEIDPGDGIPVMAYDGSTDTFNTDYFLVDSVFASQWTPTLAPVCFLIFVPNPNWAGADTITFKNFQFSVITDTGNSPYIGPADWPFDTTASTVTPEAVSLAPADGGNMIDFSVSGGLWSFHLRNESINSASSPDPFERQNTDLATVSVTYEINGGSTLDAFTGTGHTTGTFGAEFAGPSTVTAESDSKGWFFEFRHPAVAWTRNDVYTWRVTASDFSGNTYTSPDFSFTIGLDTGPSLDSPQPPDTTTGVPLTRIAHVGIVDPDDDEVDPETITVEVDDGGGAVEIYNFGTGWGSGWEDRSVVRYLPGYGYIPFFIPNAGWDSGTTYTSTIYAEDTFGEPLVPPDSWAFETGTTTSAPYATDLSPVDGADPVGNTTSLAFRLADDDWAGGATEVVRSSIVLTIRELSGTPYVAWYNDGADHFHANVTGTATSTDWPDEAAGPNFTIDRVGYWPVGLIEWKVQCEDWYGNVYDSETEVGHWFSFVTAEEVDPELRNLAPDDGDTAPAETSIYGEAFSSPIPCDTDAGAIFVDVNGGGEIEVYNLETTAVASGWTLLDFAGQTGGFRYEVQPDTSFPAGATVTVRVRVFLDGEEFFDLIYVFTIADEPPPVVIEATASPAQDTFRGGSFYQVYTSPYAQLLDVSKDDTFAARTNSGLWDIRTTQANAEPTLTGYEVSLHDGEALFESLWETSYGHAELWFQATGSVIVELSVRGITASYNSVGMNTFRAGNRAWSKLSTPGLQELSLVRDASRFWGTSSPILAVPGLTGDAPVQIRATGSGRAKLTRFTFRSHSSVGQRLMVGKKSAPGNRLFGLVPAATIQEVGYQELRIFGLFGVAEGGVFLYTLPDGKTMAPGVGNFNDTILRHSR